MSAFPDIINIIILEDKTENPISNIAAWIKLFANHKSDYYFMLPLSDERGNITITQDWLKEEIKKEQKLFIMDYSSDLNDCKSQIEIIILDRKALFRAVDAMYLFQESTGISDHDIERYKTAQNYKYCPMSKIITFDENSKLNINLSLTYGRQNLSIK